MSMEGKFKVGQECFAKYYVDGLFYRARIVSQSDHAYEVEFTEYGNRQDTYEADLLEEQIALSFASSAAAEDAQQDDVDEEDMDICQQCGLSVSVYAPYCDECGKSRTVKEDPAVRAARLELELTPWGVCKGCSSTIMMSDPCCLICGLARGASRRESFHDATTQEVPEEDASSPRKSSILNRIRLDRVCFVYSCAMYVTFSFDFLAVLKGRCCERC